MVENEFSFQFDFFLHFVLLFLPFHDITELMNTSSEYKMQSWKERPNTIQYWEERLVTLRSDVGIRHVNNKNVKVQFLNIHQHKISMNLICSIMLILKDFFLKSLWFFNAIESKFRKASIAELYLTKESCWGGWIFIFMLCAITLTIWKLVNAVLWSLHGTAGLHEKAVIYLYFYSFPLFSCAVNTSQRASWRARTWQAETVSGELVTIVMWSFLLPVVQLHKNIARAGLRNLSKPADYTMQGIKYGQMMVCCLD